MTQQTSVEPQDHCPSWASALIAKIRALEIHLGNIRPASEEAWQVANVQEVLSRMQAEETAVHNDLVDGLFAKLSRLLAEAGYEPDQIAAFINSRMPSGRLPYCSSGEVVDALGQADLS